MSVEYVIRCDTCDKVIDSSSISEAHTRRTINAQDLGTCLPWGGGDYCRGHDDEDGE